MPQISRQNSDRINSYREKPFRRSATIKRASAVKLFSTDPESLPLPVHPRKRGALKRVHRARHLSIIEEDGWAKPGSLGYYYPVAVHHQDQELWPGYAESPKHLSIEISETMVERTWTHATTHEDVTVTRKPLHKMIRLPGTQIPGDGRSRIPGRRTN